jgi:hypothetical protein
MEAIRFEAKGRVDIFMDKHSRTAADRILFTPIAWKRFVSSEIKLFDCHRC